MICREISGDIERNLDSAGNLLPPTREWEFNSQIEILPITPRGLEFMNSILCNSVCL